MIHEPLDHGTIQGLLADPESQSRRNAQKAAGCGEELKDEKAKFGNLKQPPGMYKTL